MLADNEYIKLLTAYPPRPINSQQELQNTQKIINSLLNRQQLSKDEKDYLSVLKTLAIDYEQKQKSVRDLYGVKLVKFLLSEFELRQQDLIPIFKTEAILSDVLNGKRQLTVRHIQELAEYFRISPTLFFPKSKLY
jgi:HTH-type transcriptional regulator / antitoxin HigA